MDRNNTCFLSIGKIMYKGDVFIMIMRFGYVSHAMALWDCSPAKTMTFTSFQKLSKQEREDKLYDVTRQNLEHTIRILHYNIAHEIPLYRLSSSIVPLATHPEVEFDYIGLFTPLWRKIGALIKEHNLRVSFHPNQFTLFTSDKPHITTNAITDMTYHYKVLDAIGIADSSYINIHVGGAYGNKEKAVERFHENIKKLPAHNQTDNILFSFHAALVYLKYIVWMTNQLIKSKQYVLSKRLQKKFSSLRLIERDVYIRIQV